MLGGPCLSDDQQLGSTHLPPKLTLCPQHYFLLTITYSRIFEVVETILSFYLIVFLKVQETINISRLCISFLGVAENGRSGN